MRYLLVILGPVLFCSFQLPELGHYRIKVDEYKITIVPDSCKQTITEVDKKNNRYFKLYLKNCKGAMLLECYNLRDSTLKEKGTYMASLDLLKSYVNVYNLTKHTTQIVVAKYYQPLRDGSWNYYDSVGNIIKNEVYKQGVLIDK
jgi:hypothetical protein